MNIFKETKPNSIFEFIADNDDELRKLDLIVSNKIQFPSEGRQSIILHGKYGTGKTQLAKLLPSIMEQRRVEQFDAETFNKIGVSFWSCSASGGSQTAKMAMPKARSFNQSGMHYVILDEVDNLRVDAQQSMKSFITEYRHVVYIMTTNHLRKVDEGLRSRSYCISFEKPDIEKWIQKCRAIFINNNVSCDNAFVENLVKNSAGDARKILSSIEQYIVLKKER